jgi:RNA polymerase sigma-70 factor (ECF subfamily)
MDSLTDTLRGQLPDPAVVADGDTAEIEAQLAAMVDAATRAWPDVKLSADAFLSRVAHHFSNDETLLAWLHSVRAEDLYLASACAHRIPKAIETLDREFLGSVQAILVRGGFHSVSADDVRQRVRERLFVGASKIGDYSGRGTLSSWVNVVTLRIAIDIAREQKSLPIAGMAAPVELDDAKLAGTDPELRMIKERYRAPFKVALRAALVALTSEQRNLLRLHFAEGVTLDKLAELFHIHRVTVSRRIAQARDTVFESVRARLQAELGIDRTEFDELLTLLRSRLELSLSALLPDVAS